MAKYNSGFVKRQKVEQDFYSDDNIYSTAITSDDRFRVARNFPSFYHTFQFDTGSQLWFCEKNPGPVYSEHLPYKSSIRLEVGTNIGDYHMIQTKQYIPVPLQASTNCHFSFTFGDYTANVTKRIGLFDDYNGFFLEQTGEGYINIVRRENTTGTPIETRVSQSAWNLNKLDGSTVDQYIIDFTKGQTFIIDTHWPYGLIRYGFRCRGMKEYVHYEETSNGNDSPFVSQRILPIRAQIFNTNTSVGDTMDFTATSVYIEGDPEILHRIYSSGSDSYYTSVNVGTKTPICSIRPKLTFNGLVNRGIIEIDSVDIVANSNPVFWELVYSGSLTGANWKSVHGLSITQLDTSATSVTGGVVLLSGYVGATANTRNSISIEVGKTYVPICVPDKSGSFTIPVTLRASGIAGAASIAASLNWRETR